MKNYLLIFASLIALLPTIAAAAPSRINLRIPFNTDVLVIKNKLVSIRAHCILSDNGNDILRVYTKTTSQHVLQNGRDAFNTSPTYLTSATPEADAELMAISTPTGNGEIFITMPSPSEGFVVDTDKHGGKTVFSSPVMGIVELNNEGCYLSLSVEALGDFKRVTK